QPGHLRQHVNAPELKRLNVRGCGIEDLSALAELRALEWVDVRDNEIDDVSALAGHSRMSRLFASGNRISDPRPLERLSALEWLVLDSNRIRAIGGLRDLQALKAISLTNNQIGLDNWPETAIALAALEKRVVQVHFAPQEPPSVYGDVPGSAKGPDVDVEILRGQ
ncbi:MAG: hypothetical protein AAFX94_19560, partial [Myxococcota bacterium]